MGLTLSEGFFKTKQNCEWFNFSVNVPNFVPGKWSGSDYECQSNQWHMHVYTYKDSRSLLLCRLLILLRWPIFRYSITDAVTCRGILVPEDQSAKPRSNTKVKKASGMQNTPVTIDPEVPNISIPNCIVLLLKTRDFSPDLARTKMTILQVVSPILPRLSSVSQYLRMNRLRLNWRHMAQFGSVRIQMQTTGKEEAKDKHATANQVKTMLKRYPVHLQPSISSKSPWQAQQKRGKKNLDTYRICISVVVVPVVNHFNN